ncbi:hypothetical protein JTB14_034709 [Gonioctena quinquepunctata]|nr:hypothetical protein JTB14_034709 [Gonioctena quinquepunctata]
MPSIQKFHPNYMINQNEHSFIRGFSLNEALAMLEGFAESAETVNGIIMFLPENASAGVTEEDFGAEDIFATLSTSTSVDEIPKELW